jgi:3-hydroxymyristoyl/3-hydroxydecanoyl-(acyl carrier protein) dehydratase
MNKKVNINAKIPHQYPFSFVDNIITYQENQWIVGTKTISRNDRYSFAAFPVLICEALAQLSKILETLSTRNTDSISYLANMQIDLFEAPKIGDCLQLHARAGKKLGEMISYDVEVTVSESVLLKGRLFRRHNVKYDVQYY